MTPEVIYFNGRYMISNWAEDSYALNAWDHMTGGGIKVPCLPGYPYAHAIEVPVRSGHTGFTRHFMSLDGRNVVHTQYINDSY